MYSYFSLSSYIFLFKPKKKTVIYARNSIKFFALFTYRDKSDRQRLRVGDTKHPIFLSQNGILHSIWSQWENVLVLTVFSLSLTLDSINDKNYKLPYIYYDISALFVVYILFLFFSRVIFWSETRVQYTGGAKRNK